jgi:muconolactone D-isomerase
MSASTAGGEEFLVWIRNELPASTSAEERARLVEAERVRVAELVEGGTVQRLWRVAGRRENVGIFVAPTPSALHVALESLPMYPYLKITVVPLADHVSDPGSAGRY